MALEKYNKKRDFEKTSEPKGSKKRSNIKSLRFVIQYHQARAKHYDFRLEWRGVLLSWAVPKGLSENPKVKRLAVMVEDHPVDYINFEGVIPKGNYGAGTVEIFDKGNFMPLEDLNKGLKKGHLKFVLNGEKFKGGFSLIKIDDKNWIIVKLNDEFAKKSQKKEKLPFNDCKVQLATLTENIPIGKNWIFEIKYDGYRAISYLLGDKVKIKSRNGLDYTKKFSKIAENLIALNQTCVLDGEVVAFDSEGRSDFGLLQERIKGGGELHYVVFDILAIGSKDLREKSLKERKEILEKTVNNSLPNLVISSYVEGKGRECFNLAKKLNFEGIIAKDVNSSYKGKRSEDWLKIKCYKRQEFVIIGFTQTEKNKDLSAVLLGYFDKGELVYVGKSGTGLTEQMRRELKNKLEKIKTQKNIFDIKDAIFVKPNLVAEIQFAEFTKEGLLRQASFIGLRTDKKARDVIIEAKYGK